MYAKAAVKERRLKMLKRKAVNMSRLTLTSLLPQLAYHTQAQGANLTMCKRMRKAVNQAEYRVLEGKSATVLAQLTHGDRDPMVQLPAQFVQNWILLMGYDPRVAQLAIRWWGRIGNRLKDVPEQSRWNAVRGPIGAVIVTLWQQGWDPETAHLWKDPTGQQHQMQPDKLTRVRVKLWMKEVFIPTVRAGLWSKTAESWQWPELSQEPNLKQVRRKMARLQAKGHHEKAKALASIVARGAWSEQRRARAAMVLDPTCLRCGEAVEDLRHRCKVSCFCGCVEWGRTHNQTHTKHTCISRCS